MIKTVLKPGFDPLLEIPAGSRVAILGCASCGAVYGTSDTRRIEEISRLLEGHCDIVFSGTIEAPCDQRALRHFLKDPSCQVTSANAVLCLACEAGARSLGSLLESMPGTRIFVNPLETRQFSILRADGKSIRACRFCETCDRPSAAAFCPVAVCPLGRRDGPCQNRPARPESGVTGTSDTVCIVDPDLTCPWMETAPNWEYPSLQDNVAEIFAGFDSKALAGVQTHAKANFHGQGQAIFEGRAIVTEPGTDPDSFCEALLALVRSESPSLVFLAPGEGLDPIGAAAILLSRGFQVPLGLAADSGRMNARAIDSLMISANALGFRGFYAREGAVSHSGVSLLSTVGLIEMARRHFGPHALILADNACRHPADLVLLCGQLPAGLSAAVLRMGVNASDGVSNMPCPVLIERSLESQVSSKCGLFNLICGRADWPEAQR